VSRLGRCALLLTAAKVGAIRTVSTAAMTSAPAMHAETILATVALVVTVLVLAGILLRLATAGDECRQAADLLSTFLTTLIRLLLILLRLMLRAVMHLLIARRERLGIARQIRLLLGFARSVARLVLAHEGLAVVIIAVKSLVGVLLTGGALLLLRLLVVVWILLTELFLRGGNQAKVVLSMLVVVLGRNRIARTLRVARELDIFFRYMRSGAANFDVGTV
jgi:hypothetical protein